MVLGTLKLLELGMGEGHVVLKFRVGKEIVQCKVSRKLSAFKGREVTGNYIEFIMEKNLKKDIYMCVCVYTHTHIYGLPRWH